MRNSSPIEKLCADNNRDCKHRAEFADADSDICVVGERSMCAEGIPEGVLERILVRMHGMSKR